MTVLIICLVASIILNVVFFLTIMKGASTPEFDINDLVVLDKNDLALAFVMALKNAQEQLNIRPQKGARKKLYPDKYYRVRSKRIETPINLHKAVEVVRLRDLIDPSQFILVQKFLPTKGGFYMTYTVPKDYIAPEKTDAYFNQQNFAIISSNPLFPSNPVSVSDVIATTFAPETRPDLEDMVDQTEARFGNSNNE